MTTLLPQIYSKIDKRIINILNLLVLISALIVINDLSYSILTNGYYDPEHGITLKIQLWVCAVFLLDFLVRFIIAKNKLRFFFHNIFLLIFSIPYLNIIHYYNTDLPQQTHYLLSLVPLLRAGFGLAVIIRWYTRRTTTSLLFAYLSVLTAVVYFGSLLFFVMERGVNTLVTTYWDALWWAFMDMTTVGSNIIAVTPIGKILSVLLAALGMMMLPIFTVYITDKMRILNNKNPKE